MISFAAVDESTNDVVKDDEEEQEADVEPLKTASVSDCNTDDEDEKNVLSFLPVDERTILKLTCSEEETVSSNRATCLAVSA